MISAVRYTEAQDLYSGKLLGSCHEGENPLEASAGGRRPQRAMVRVSGACSVLGGPVLLSLKLFRPVRSVQLAGYSLPPFIAENPALCGKQPVLQGVCINKKPININVCVWKRHWKNKNRGYGTHSLMT